MDIDSAGHIFIGGQSEFGFLAPDPKGGLQYFSISDLLPSEQKYFLMVYETAVTSYGVFFRTTYKLFYYDYKSLKILKAKTKFKKLFVQDDILFVRQSQLGFMIYSNDSLVLFPAGKKFNKQVVKSIFPFKQNQYIILGSKNIATYNTAQNKSLLRASVGELTTIQTPVDSYLINNKINSGLRLKNNGLVFNTHNGGVVISDSELQNFEVYNIDNGLPDNRILQSLIDGQNNLWLATFNGISKLDYQSPFNFYSDNSGIIGSIYDISVHNGSLYISTDRGAFFCKMASTNQTGSINRNDNLDFIPINNIKTQSWQFSKSENSLFVATDHGTFEINNNLAQLISAKKSMSIHYSKKEKSTIFIGGGGLFLVLTKTGSNWIETKSIIGISAIVRTITEEINQNSHYYHDLWLGTLLNGVYRVKLSENLDLLSLDQYGEKHGLPRGEISTYILNNKVAFTTKKGLYQFDDDSKTFVPNDLLGEKFADGSRDIYRIVESADHEYYIFSNFEFGINRKINNKPIWDNSTFKSVDISQVNAIYIDSNTCWFGGQAGVLVKYDVANKKEFRSRYPALIRKILIGNDSIIYAGNNYKCNLYGNDCHAKWGNADSLSHSLNHVVLKSQSELFKYKLPFRFNSVTFEFAAPFFTKEEKTRYNYWLDGNDQSWTGWSKETRRQYTNLPEGDYKFYVKALNIYDQESSVATYEFTILPPWYRTGLAYIGYIFLFIAVVHLSVMISLRRLRSAKKRLERIVKDRTIEIVEKNQMLEKQKEEIEHEKDKSENLLLNILPRVTAEELKSKGKATPHYYDKTTVLFTDFKGFTMVAEKMHPDDLIAELDICFNSFDKIIEEHHIEKIKTIGDAYMCAGGIPKKNVTNPVDAVLAGLKIQKFMEEFKKERLQKNKPFWEIRIGIHTGPIVAGVVGSKKFAYDIWGDTVNTASRMESSGEAGRVNISGTTYKLVEEYFNCTYRGKVKAKNKGEIDMYFVDGITTEFSSDENHNLPNKSFVRKLNTISIESIGRAQSLDEMDFNFLEVQRYVKKRFKKEFPKDLYYHDLDHTMDVCHVAEELAKEERVDNANIILLKTAALLHDIGFLEQYKDHEKKGVKITQNILPGFGYTIHQIEAIGGMIMATKIPQLPKNHLEEIICDADLDYLGRDDFEEISLKLKKEFQAHEIVNSDFEWEQVQLNFFKEHKYFTKYSIQKRNPSKLSAQKQIEKRIAALQPNS